MRWSAKNHSAVCRATQTGRYSSVFVVAFLFMSVLASGRSEGAGAEPRTRTVASWYGEGHRGKLMANGKKFNPDRLTAASWFYELGTKVKVTTTNPRHSVVVTITDRGPAWYLVRDGRAIDLSQAAFKRLASADEGLVEVTLKRVR